MNFLDRSSKTTSNKSHQIPSNSSIVVSCWHTDGRTDRHKVSYIPLSQFFVRFQWNMKFLKRFSKIHQNFSIGSLVQRNRQREGQTLWIEIKNFGTPINALVIYIRPAKSLAILQRVVQVSYYFLSGQHSYTCSRLGDINALSSECPSFNTKFSSNIKNHTEALSGNTSFYITTTAFLTITIYYKLQNALWTDEYCVHKMNPDIHLMCEMHAIVKLYRAACCLSDAGWHFFMDQRISWSWSLLNVCTTAQQYVSTKVRLSKKKLSR
jgi:hypothetical protein